MKIRALLVAASVAAAIVLPANAGPAMADGGVDVGGGAAGVVADVLVVEPALRPHLGTRYVGYTLAAPSVTMGRDGGSLEGDATTVPAQLAPEQVPVAIGPQLKRAITGLPFSAQVSRVSVFGNRFGTPYAQADVNVASLTIPGQAVSLKGLNVHCVWDTNGARASVTMQNAVGETVGVAPNTRVELPGLGHLTLNEQSIRTIDVYDATGAPRQAQVITVIGAHLHLSAQAESTYGAGDVSIGWAACDPLNLPPLSGLKVQSGAVAGESGLPL